MKDILPSREAKPLFTEIEENNCISIYKLGDNTFTKSKQEFSV